MKTFMQCIAIALIFFVGTTALIHVDRQSGQMHRQNVQIIESLENIIEKYVSLR